MNNSYTIDELIAGYFENEFSEVIDIPMPKVSLKHRIKMNRIFKEFEKNKKKNTAKPVQNYELSCNNHYTLRQRLIITAIIIVCLAFLTGFIAMFISNGFQGTVHNDNTHLFAVNVENCPSTIEKVYKLSVVPDDYKVYETGARSNDVFTVYINSYGQKLIFTQTVKKHYNSHINTEGYAFEETSINGFNAVYVEFNKTTGKESLIIWDNDDYILELTGVLTKDDIINLAISNENCGF